MKTNMESEISKLNEAVDKLSAIVEDLDRRMDALEENFGKFITTYRLHIDNINRYMNHRNPYFARNWVIKHILDYGGIVRSDIMFTDAANEGFTERQIRYAIKKYLSDELVSEKRDNNLWYWVVVNHTISDKYAVLRKKYKAKRGKLISMPKKFSDGKLVRIDQHSVDSGGESVSRFTKLESWKKHYKRKITIKRNKKRKAAMRRAAYGVE